MKFINLQHSLLRFETDYWNRNLVNIAGVDEAGRGPLAGPVVAAAVVFPPFCEKIPVVNDSKKLSEKQRRELNDYILSSDYIQYSIVEISAAEIDEINILEAARKAMRKAVSKLSGVDYALIDGLKVPNFPVSSCAIVKGDAQSASIAAASILAKVYRDEKMKLLALEYPQYEFEKHKGYPTKYHIELLRKYGPSPVHRKSFGPVKQLLKEFEHPDLI